jgi:hypothetical protein
LFSLTIITFNFSFPDGLPGMSQGVGNFPFFSTLRKHEKNRIAKLWKELAVFIRRNRSGGGVVSQISAARLLGISPPRVWKLIGEGRLQAISYNGRRFVTSDSLREWASQEHKIRKPRIQR